MGFLGRIRIITKSANEEVFKEYKQLGAKRMSLEQKFVAFFHLIAAFAISLIQLQAGIIEWFRGNGIILPILLIVHGFIYSSIENDSWYREQMVPFISRLISTTEIETDRYCQYRRRVVRSILIIGYSAILLCQWIWTFGLTEIAKISVGNDILLGVIVELAAYGVFFGPFILYVLLLIPITFVLEKLMQSRYKDVAHLIDIKNKWTRENQRRAKDSESVQDENNPHDRLGF